MATRIQSGAAESRPTGTVTFLFSDIEGSTERWERHAEEMARALSRHDALVRSILESRGGYVFKTMGDAFCAAFTRPEEAVAAALDAQIAIGREGFEGIGGLRVRMALHTGTANERDGDYFGPAVNRVSRLLAIAHGGQVIVSGTTRDVLSGAMPPRMDLRELGSHRLRDLAQPERVFQLIAPELPDVFPALRSLDGVANNLPSQLTSFVGRDAELLEIKSLVERHRLVTLVGAGGAGKTRCAVQVGAELLDGSGDGVWLAELAAVSDASLVPEVIAHALGVSDEPNRPAIESALAWLKRKRLLLVLDNCEHVIEQAREVVDVIVRTCPDVRLIATSREPLAIAGERVYRMPSLAVSGAVTLFADRAIAADARFTLSAENEKHVAEICRELDGIPLAIELAAARVKVLSPQQLVQRLNERFRVLTGGNRRALPRQQTMRALVDWSYDLLSEAERALFRRLGTFAGGFTLEAAATVCCNDDVDEIAVLDLLSSLVDKSLVQAEPSEIGTRYRLLETLRRYALERLSDAGEYSAAARAHALAFLQFAEEAAHSSETVPDKAWRLRTEPEIENVRAALQWSIGNGGDAEIGRALAAATAEFWYTFGPVEGLRWALAAMETVDSSTPEETIGRLELTAAALHCVLSQYRATREEADRALGHLPSDGARDRAKAKRYKGISCILSGDREEGEKLFEEALLAFQQLGMPKAVSISLHWLGVARTYANDHERARALLRDSLAAARSSGGDGWAMLSLINLAELEFKTGDVEAAIRMSSEALLGSLDGSGRRAAVALSNMAAYLIAAGRFGEARARAREALRICRDAEFQVWTAFTLQHLAAVAALEQDGGGDEMEKRCGGVRLLGYVDERLRALNAVREWTEQREYDKILAKVRESVGTQTCEDLLRQGALWNEDRAVAEAVSL